MDLFDQVVALPPPEREAHLAAAAPEVASFVRAMISAESSFLKTGQGLDVLAEQLSDTDPPPPPETVPGFRLLGLLGEGGMGRVFEAEQESPRRKVALKLIHPWLVNDRSRQWLRNEAAALAALLHPNIPQVYALVEHDEHVFLTMERVEGQPLHEVWRDRPLSDRVALLVQVAAAVSHAHGRGFLHLDLKPGNILVTAEGQPKVLDFGLARAVDSGAGPIAGTPAYMAPEQVRGEVLDVRADVFALGQVLKRALQGSDAAELSAVVRRATASEPDARYPNVEALREELVRFLQQRPVHAYGGGATYAFGKWLRRRPVIATAAAVVMSVLLGATAFSIDRAERAEQARAEAAAAQEAAQLEARRAQVTSEFLTEVFLTLDPQVTLGERTLLDGALTAIARMDEGALSEAAQEEAQIRLVIAEALLNLRRVPDALEQLEAVESLYEAGGLEPDGMLVDALHGTAQLTHRSKSAADALPIAERAIALAQSLEDESRLLGLRHELGVIYRENGEQERARAELEAVLVGKRTLHARGELPQRQLTSTMMQLGYTLQMMGEPAGAETLALEALELERAELEAPHPSLANRLHWLADCYQAQFKSEPALAAIEEAGAMRDALGIAPETSSRPQEHTLRGRALLSLQRYAEAEDAIYRYADLVYDGQRSRLHRNDAWTLASSLAQQGRGEEAWAVVEHAVAREAGAAAGSGAEAWTFLLRGSVGAQLGRADTRPDLERAVAFWEERLGPAAPRVMRLRQDLAR